MVDPIWVHPATGQAIPPGADNPLGSRWIGFHRDCKPRKGFNGNANLKTQGCVRLQDEQAQDLFGLVQLGTPVTVLP